MLNNIGLPGLLLIAVVVLVLFGRGKISEVMGDVAKGIKSFKKGMADDPVPEAKADPKVIDNAPTGNATATTTETDSTKSS